MKKQATKPPRKIQGLSEDDWAAIYLQAAKESAFTLDGKAFNARFEELAQKAKGNG